MKFLSSRPGAFVLLAVGYALVFNPFVKFPWPMIIVAVFALCATWLQRGEFRSIGIGKVSAAQLATALGLFFAIELFMDFIVQPQASIWFNEPADYSAFASLEGNLPKFLTYFVLTWISAAFAEELFFRGFVIAQLELLIGKYRVVQVVVSALLFTLPHMYQGPTGILVTFVFGLAFGAVFVKWKNLWMNVLIHGLVDSLFLLLAYLGMLSYYN